MINLMMLAYITTFHTLAWHQGKNSMIPMYTHGGHEFVVCFNYCNDIVIFSWKDKELHVRGEHIIGSYVCLSRCKGGIPQGYSILYRELCMTLTKRRMCHNELLSDLICWVNARMIIEHHSILLIETRGLVCQYVLFILKRNTLEATSFTYFIGE